MIHYVMCGLDTCYLILLDFAFDFAQKRKKENESTEKAHGNFQESFEREEEYVRRRVSFFWFRLYLWCHVQNGL